jgi:hypothetical protein
MVEAAEETTLRSLMLAKVAAMRVVILLMRSVVEKVPRWAMLQGF